MKKILYLHGFASSGASGTVELLRREFWGKDVSRRVAVDAPDIPVDPAEALPMLRAIVEKEQPALIVGTSLGGFYAQQLRGFERICVNPAFAMSRMYSALHVGKYQWLNRRRNGEREFHVTKETIAHFREAEDHQFEGVDEFDQLLCHGLFGDEDEFVTDSRPLFESHYPGQAQTFHGGHRMNDDVVKHVLVPFIRSLNAV